MKRNDKKYGPLFWIPVIWNGITLLVTLVVGITFLLGSMQPSDAQVDLPDIILVFFTIFDVLLMISPLMLVVMVLISIVNVIRGRSKMERFFPLTFSTIMQGLLSALLLTSITQPVG